MTIKNANFYSVQMRFYFYVCSYDRNCKSVFNRIIFLQHNLELYNFPIIPKTLSQKELHKMLVFNRKNRKGSVGLIHNLNELLVGLKGLQQKLVYLLVSVQPESQFRMWGNIKLNGFLYLSLLMNVQFYSWNKYINTRLLCRRFSGVCGQLIFSKKPFHIKCGCFFFCILLLTLKYIYIFFFNYLISSCVRECFSLRTNKGGGRGC